MDTPGGPGAGRQHFYGTVIARNTFSGQNPSFVCKCERTGRTNGRHPVAGSAATGPSWSGPPEIVYIRNTFINCLSERLAVVVVAVWRRESGEYCNKKKPGKSRVGPGERGDEVCMLTGYSATHAGVVTAVVVASASCRRYRRTKQP